MASTPTSKIPLIVRILLEKGDLTQEQIDGFPVPIGSWPKNSEAYMVEQGFAEDRLVATRLAEYLGCTWLDVDPDMPTRILQGAPGGDPKVMGEIADLLASTDEAVSRIPESVFRGRMVVPVRVQDGNLHVVCMDPMDFSAIEEIRMLSGMSVISHVGTQVLFKKLLKAAFSGRDKLSEVINSDDDSGSGSGDGPKGDTVDVDVARSLPGGRDSQVLRMVNTILLQAIEEGASDIHLEPYEASVRVRYRVDGQLREVTPPPFNMFGQVVSRLKILAKMDIAEKRKPQDGAIAMKNGEHRVDLRVSTVPCVYGEKVVMRVLEKNAIPTKMEMLGFSEEQAADFLEAAESHHGLMFVTGPTGSGKSTTLYCSLNLVNRPTKNIATVEDPVEYKMTGMNQVQVNPAAGLDFASALRAFLRQDPDVIMVGEVRDTETAGICMRAALTGHLVLSTLHTNSALQVVTRLTDMGIEPFLLGPALRLLEAQRLVRRLCSECKEPVELPGDSAERHGLEEGMTIYRPGSNDMCMACKGAGYKGRLGIYEVVKMDEELVEMISTAQSQADMEKYVLGRGTDLLPQSGRKRVIEGLTSLEEVSDYIRVD
ncbi:MAG: GspE/PulE family protein [Planctomycetota bacterium]